VSVLVAGIGNIFLGDDAFGVEVAQRLARHGLPHGVRVVDFGIRGFDLAHALLEEQDASVVLVDATPRGGEPGTLYVIEPSLEETAAPSIETHAMDPLRVLRLACSMGARPKKVLLVGCEPQPLDADELEAGLMGLSQPVAAAIDSAVELVKTLVEKEANDAGSGQDAENTLQ
jgi:hydrogenase maturation protease